MFLVSVRGRFGKAAWNQGEDWEGSLEPNCAASEAKTESQHFCRFVL